MRPYESLKSDDFPGVKPADFIRWQKAIVSANKMMWLFYGIWAVVFLSIIFFLAIGSDLVLGVHYYLGIVPTVILFFGMMGINRVGFYLIRREADDIARRISITEKMVKEARSTGA